MDQPNQGKFNERRRKLLKFAAFGSAAFILGKILAPLNVFSSSGEYKNFRVVDEGDRLYVYDKKGNELLVIEKDSPSSRDDV